MPSRCNTPPRREVPLRCIPRTRRREGRAKTQKDDTGEPTPKGRKRVTYTAWHYETKTTDCNKTLR